MQSSPAALEPGEIIVEDGRGEAPRGAALEHEFSAGAAACDAAEKMWEMQPRLPLWVSSAAYR